MLALNRTSHLTVGVAVVGLTNNDSCPVQLLE